MSFHPLANKRILLGVTGAATAARSVELAAELRKAGALVDVLLSRSAEGFVSALSFQAVTGRAAFTEKDLWSSATQPLYVQLGSAADLLVIAPATANTLARLALGLADTLLSMTALCVNGPVLLAPDLDARMLANPAVQANVALLKQRGFVFAAGPEGRYPEPDPILEEMAYVISRAGKLRGRKVVVTAGAVREPIDRDRLLTNRSSGRQGYAVAQAALDAGAEVTLISAPASLEVPFGARKVNVLTAADMQAAALAESRSADVLILAAAPLMIRPKETRSRQEGLVGPTQLELVESADVVAAVCEQRKREQHPRRVVSFSYESSDVMENARSSLHQMNLDLVVAYDIEATDWGFEINSDQVSLLFADGRTETLPTRDKEVVAQRLIAKIAEWF